MESKHFSRLAGMPLLGIGIAFAAVSFFGPPALLGAGMALVGLGLACMGIALGQPPRRPE